MEGLEEIIGFCDTMEKFEFDKSYNELMKNTAEVSRERIKKAQLERIEDLSRTH